MTNLENRIGSVEFDASILKLPQIRSFVIFILKQLIKKMLNQIDQSSFKNEF